MDLTALLGQKFIIGFPETYLTEAFKERVRRYKYGNFILFHHNLVDLKQTVQLCSELHKLALDATSHPPLITLDQEGGMVTRLTDDRIIIPGAMALAATRDPDVVEQMNRINGEILKALGFSMNLAPTLDVNNEPDNPIIGVRSYGDRPDAVIRYGNAAVRGLQSAGVMACGKHFPGHGDTHVDSHLGLPHVDKNREAIDLMELKPFVAAVKAGIAGIMSTHILFPALEDKRQPATMSRKILSDLLRGEMGFHGLILTDCMEMQAISRHYGTAEGVVKAFAADADLAIISHTASRADHAFERVMAALESGELERDTVVRSIERILAAKSAYFETLPTFEGLSNASIERYAEIIEAVLPKTFVSCGSGLSLPLPQGSGTLVIGPDLNRGTSVENATVDPESFAEVIGARLKADFAKLPLDPDLDTVQRLVQEAKPYDRVILGLYLASDHTGQIQLLRQMATQHPSLLVVALKSPYDLMYCPDDVSQLAIFEYTKKALRVLGDVLAEGIKPEGAMPIDLPRRLQRDTQYILGLDGGGTSTELGLYPLTDGVLRKRPLVTFSGGSANLNSAAPENVAEVLKHLLAEVLALVPADSLLATGFGVAGISKSGVRAQMEQLLRQAGYPEPYVLMGDHEAALTGALDNEPGVLLIAGTGSIGVGKIGEGRILRSGGYGHILDDLGSGYAIGREILSVWLQMHDGRRPKTYYYDRLIDLLEADDADSALDKILDIAYARPFSKARLAQVVNSVVETIRAPEVEWIMAAAADDLIDLLRALLRQMGENQDPQPLVLHGGLLERCPPFRSIFDDKLKSSGLRVSVREAAAVPTYGAARKAKEAIYA